MINTLGKTILRRETMKRKQILNPGPPPLTLEAADAAIDLIDFIAAVVRGVDLIDVTPEVREAWHQYLASHYAEINPSDRNWFALIASQAWSEIQERWPTMPLSEKVQLKQAWTPRIANLLSWVEPVLQSANQWSAPDQQQAPYSNNAGSSYGEPYQGRQGYGTQENFLMRQILENQRMREQEAAQVSPEHAYQVQQQHQAAMAQMLSNMSQMRFQTMMNTVKNMKY
jgi:hypothetical protein